MELRDPRQFGGHGRGCTGPALEPSWRASPSSSRGRWGEEGKGGGAGGHAVSWPSRGAAAPSGRGGGCRVHASRLLAADSGTDRATLTSR